MKKSDALKLYLNENLSPRLAAQLRRNGFDVVASQEVGMRSRSDPEQMAFACSQQRAILTYNIRDFVKLHREYVANEQEHWGIIISRRLSFGLLIHHLIPLFNSISAEELKNQLRWLKEFRR